ncbi:unnamed protein product [Absidia cylindrospora]
MSRAPLPRPRHTFSSLGGPPSPNAIATTSSQALAFSEQTSSQAPLAFSEQTSSPAPLAFSEQQRQSTSSSSSTSPTETEDKSYHQFYIKPEEADDHLTTNNMETLIAQKRKRRESHNEVERKRRDNINARIDELSTLLPQKYHPKPNRGMILQDSVDHIKFLYQRVEEQQQRIYELEQMLGESNPNDDHHHHHPGSDIAHTQDYHQQQE